MNSKEDSKINEIFKDSTNETPNCRPQILNIIIKFITIFQTKVQIEKTFATYEDHFNFLETLIECIKTIQKHSFH